MRDSIYNAEGGFSLTMLYKILSGGETNREMRPFKPTTTFSGILLIVWELKSNSHITTLLKYCRVGETWTPQPIKQASSNQLFNSTDTTRLRRWLVFINTLHSIDLLSWGFQPHRHLYRYHTLQSKIFKFLINSPTHQTPSPINTLIYNE